MPLVVLLGMHRSGTSLLSRALHAAGLEPIGPVASTTWWDNLDGHWEDIEVRDINDQLLSQSGGSWKSPPTELRPSEAVLNRMRAYLAKIPKNRLVGWKDPRTLLTWPVWATL